MKKWSSEQGFKTCVVSYIDCSAKVSKKYSFFLDTDNIIYYGGVHISLLSPSSYLHILIVLRVSTSISPSTSQNSRSSSLP